MKTLTERSTILVLCCSIVILTMVADLSFLGLIYLGPAKNSFFVFCLLLSIILGLNSWKAWNRYSEKDERHMYWVIIAILALVYLIFAVVSGEFLFMTKWLFVSTTLTVANLWLLSRFLAAVIRITCKLSQRAVPQNDNT